MTDLCVPHLLFLWFGCRNLEYTSPASSAGSKQGPEKGELILR